MTNKASAIALIVLFTALTKLLGFGREAVLASAYGASKITDAYLVAQTIPNLFITSIGAVLMTVAIPALSRVGTTKGRDAFVRASWNLFHALVLILTGITIVLFLFAVPLIRWVAPDMESGTRDLVVSMFPYMLPVILGHGVATWATTVLHSQRNFFRASLADLPFNLILIAVILASQVLGSMALLALGLAIATIGRFVVQLPAIRLEGLSYQWVLDWREPTLVAIGRSLPPLLITVSLTYVGTFADRFLASGLPEGSLAGLGYGQRVFELLWGLLVVPLATIQFPHLSALASEDDLKRYSQAFSRGLATLTFFSLPAVVGLLVLTVPVTRMLFERGQFGAAATSVTALVIFWYLLGMPARAWLDYLNRGFYSLRDTRTPMVVGAATAVCKVLLNVLLVHKFGLAGLAAATSLSALVGALFLHIFLMRTLRRSGARPDMTAPVRTLVKTVLASLLMGTVVGPIAWGLRLGLLPGSAHVGGVQHIINLLGVVGVGGGVFIGAARLFRVPQLRTVMDIVVECTNRIVPQRLLPYIPMSLRSFLRHITTW